MRTNKLILIALTLGLALAGCGEKIDCAKLNTKFETCGTQLFMKIAGTKYSAEQLASIPPDKMKEALTGMTGTITGKCSEEGGKFSDAKDMNVCLGKASCDEFADCMSKFLE